MRKTIQLSTQELDLLITQIDKAFRKYEGLCPEIKWNSYLGNYDVLAESIFHITNQLGCSKDVGSRPLRHLLYYKLSNKSYQLYLIDACYLYIYNKTRQEYLEGKESSIYRIDKSLMADMLKIGNTIYEQGNAKEAKKILEILFSNSKEYNLIQTDLKLYAEICLILGKTKMQLGEAKGKYGALSLAVYALEAFMQLKELKGIVESYQLLGIVHRQLEQFSDAIQHYEKVLALTENENSLRFRKYHTLHDLAVSHFLFAEQTSNQKYFNYSSHAFQQSNDYFLKQEPDFCSIASIRMAELYIKQGQWQQAVSLLEPYEDAVEFATLQLPHQMLFFRINAERYLKSGNIEKATKFLKAGLKLSQQEAYQYQTVLCNRLYHQYRKTIPAKEIVENQIK